MGSAISTSGKWTDTDSHPSRPNQFLVYNLNRQSFACPIERVHEVMGLQPILPIDDAPPFVKGGIPVRRKLVPVIDLRLMLGMPARVPNRRNCVLLVTVGNAPFDVRIGLIVDSVVDVMEIDPSDVREAPDGPCGERAGLVTGTTRARGQLTRLINVDVLLTKEECVAIASLAA
ncbi:MAG: chemotaxis protein CheW [Acidobacteriales bacterium]|nr:chemotaxis protein CheW [Terriglobales bacterium]